MSDIRFNRWLHQSGTGGVYQAGSGNVGIGSSVPSTTLSVNGTISATSVSATSISSASASFSGDVTVGGKLTYDDVTNIDSVGVITARSGINVTGGNVGINTSTPRALVDFGPGTGNGTLNQTVSNYQAVFEAPTGTGNYTRNIAFASRTSAISAAINAVDEGGSDATGLIVATGTAGAIAERLRLTSNGTLLVGLTAAVGEGGTPADLNSTEVGRGYINLSRDDTASADHILFGKNGSVAASVGTDTTNTLVFKTGTTERLRIDSAGNTTLGYAGSSLHIQNGFNNSTARIQNGGGSNNSELKFLVKDAGTESEKMRLTSTAGLAVVTAGSMTANAGNETLWIQGEGHNGHGTGNTRSVVSIIGAISSNNSGIGIWMGARTNENTAVIGTRTANGHLAFETYSGGWGERMRLTNDGKLLIGTTSNFVRGQIQVIDGGGGELTIGRNDTTVTSGNDLGHLFFASNDENGTGVIAASINAYANDNHTSVSAPTALTFSTTPVNATSPTEKMRIDQHGNVFFGATTNTAPFMRFTLDSGGGYFEKDTNSTNSRNAFIFRINGNSVGSIVTSGSNTAFNTSASDRTLKKNFEDWTEEVLTYFKSLNPQQFNFINQEDGTDKTKGYIAQDLVDKFPEAYPKDEETDKYLFNPSGMVPYLMKALQEEIVKREALEQRLTDAGL